MRAFYFFQKRQSVIADLSWTHYLQLLSLKEESKIQYYINITKSLNLSIRQLREKIKSKEYERLPESTRNKLINKKEPNIKELIPEPIIIKCNFLDKEKLSEKLLHKLIVENIKEFMEQLGEGYSYIGDEYKIRIGESYNYIDLLLFNYIYNCFVVVELKVTELKSEHIGQIEKYINYIDLNVKNINQNKTICLILVKENNKFVIKYSTDKSIISRSYSLI
jgi:predicted nuclease of restriction endonuclease-like (RecB) superfamily